MKLPVDKKLLKDKTGCPLTQSLFLEIEYNREYAVYSMKDYDYEFEGKVYPSIKKLYLECEDITEYEFANKYFLSWGHWTRICENKKMLKHIESWREELELKIKSQAIRDVIALSSESSGFQAAKWLAKGEWKTRGAGRPSKAEVEKERRIADRLSSEFDEDLRRMQDLRIN